MSTNDEQLKAATARYKEARKLHERSIVDAQNGVVDAVRGTTVASVGFTGPTLHTWTININRTFVDVAGFTADVTRLSGDEKKPIRLELRAANGAMHSFSFKKDKQSKAEAFARSVISQAQKASEGSDQRQRGIAAALERFDRAVTGTDRILPAASEYAALSDLGTVTEPGPSEWIAEDLASAKSVDVVKSATAWLPGDSPTVRNRRLKLAGATVALVLTLGGCITWVVIESGPESLEEITESGCAVLRDLYADRLSEATFERRYEKVLDSVRDAGYTIEEYEAAQEAECSSEDLAAEARAQTRESEAATSADDRSNAESAGPTVEVPPMRGLNLHVADDRFTSLDLRPIDIAPNVVLERSGERSRTPFLYENWIIVAQCSIGERVPSGSDLTVGVVKAEEEINGNNMIAGLYDGLLSC